MGKAEAIEDGIEFYDDPIMVGFETKMLSIPAELIEKDIQKLGDLIKKRIDMP